MKSSSVSDTALATAIAHQGEHGNAAAPRRRGVDQAAGAFMPRATVLATCLALAAGSAALVTAAIFALSLLFAEAADLAHWAIYRGAALPEWDATRVLALLEASGVCGLACGALAVALFCRDLARQRWF